MWYCYKEILYICVTLKIAFCCDCNKINNSQKDTESVNLEIGKIQIEDNTNNTLAIPYKKAYAKEEEEPKGYISNGTRFKADVAEDETNDSQENKYVTCPALRNGIARNLDRMPDVWQTVYYRAAETLSCFKIYIRKTTVHERKYYAQAYGDFNGRVSWIDCLLEIRSSEKHYSVGRKHFLQGDMRKSVFENIIILKGNSSDETLSVEGPDQWMVFNNILLMRDCVNGNIIVFARVPHQPRLGFVLHSLKRFGEESPDGIIPCVDNGRIGRSINIIPKDILRRHFRI